MKVNYEACDLCGGSIDDETIEFKCKKHWASGPNYGKRKIKLCICSRCLAELRRMVQRGVRRPHGN